MGYSGYTQYLCAQGHYSTSCVYNETPETCSFCASRLVWRNGVDTTNGSYCEIDLTDEEWEALPETLSQEAWDALLYCKGCDMCDEGRIDGLVKLEMVREATICTCAGCGHQHLSEPAVYVIPTDKGRKI